MPRGWVKPCMRGFAILALAVATLPTTVATAQPRAETRAPPVDILDGQRFTGEFDPADQSAGRPDDFIFAEGKFHSRECLKIGFAPGPYWVRTENGRLLFFARLTSEENGVTTYDL